MILEKLLEVGRLPFEIFFPPQYAHTKIWRDFFGLDDHPSISRRTVSSLLSRLKKQKLVIRTGEGRNAFWRLTKRGKIWLHTHSESIREELPRDGITRLVIFDIPERERRKRTLLRTELIACQFQKLQRSVWIGFNPLPERFIRFLDDLHLKNHVHIFSVREGGTIEVSAD